MGISVWQANSAFCLNCAKGSSRSESSSCKDKVARQSPQRVPILICGPYWVISLTWAEQEKLLFEVPLNPGVCGSDGPGCGACGTLGRRKYCPSCLLTFAIPNGEAEHPGFPSLLKQRVTLQQLSARWANARFCCGGLRGPFYFLIEEAGSSWHCPLSPFSLRHS